MKDCALVCDHKFVIHIPSGCNIANLTIVLIAFCHTFNIRYAEDVEEVMEFLQDKLLGLTEKKKHGIAYNNLYRAVTCHQDKISGERTDTASINSDATMLEDQIESQVSLFRC